MAKVTGISIGLSEQAFEITKGMSRELGKQAVPLAEKRVREIAEGEYHNLMSNLRQTLSPNSMTLGTTQVVKGASVPIKFVRSRGGGGVLTQHWRGLTERYAKRSPRSTKFWHKTGQLFSAWTRMRRPTVRVTELASSRSHHKGRINTKFELRFSPLPPALRQLKITESFTQAQRLPLSRLRTGWRRGLGRAVVPEKERPFMRDMAAALGKDLRKNLRKI